MKKALKITLFVGVLLALAILGIKAVKHKRAQEAALPAAKIYPLVVNTITPAKSEVKLTLPYLAEVHNDRDVELASRFAARIVSIKHSGAKVKKGDIVARLDTTDIESALASAKDELKAAQVARDNLAQTHRRTLELLKVQGASIEASQTEATQLASLDAKIAGLKQKVRGLQNNLSYAVITSPVDGTVSKTFDNVGSTSMPGKPLLSIRAQNGFYLLVRVPTTLAINGVILDGKAYKAVSLGSTFHGLAEYKVYTDDHRLSTGDRIEVSVIVFKGRATELPFDAVLDRNGKNYVLVADGKHASEKAVEVLQSGQEGVAVRDDLHAKKIIVAKPDVLLKLLGGYAFTVKE